MSKYYSGWDYYKYKELFSRSLKDMSPLYQGQTDPITFPYTLNRLVNDLTDVGYSYNTSGYRCKEFFEDEPNKTKKIMTLGCSNTFGYGLEVEKTWPHILSDKMGVDYVNLSKGGDGAQAQVIKAFQFFKEFYHPTHIFAVLPLYRLEFPKVKNMIHTEKHIDKDVFDPRILQHFFTYENNSFKKIAKSPYNLEEILPVDVSIFYSMMFIQMLEQYCASNNIKLSWTTYDLPSWDSDQAKNKEAINSPNFLIIDGLATWHPRKKCHQGLSMEENFENAADNFHPGLHKNIHIAEAFYERFKDML